MGERCCGGGSRRHFIFSAGGSALLAASWTASLAAMPGIASAFATQDAAAPANRLHAFDLADVTLDESPFLHAQRKTEAYLLTLQPDRMLHNFRVNAGLEPKAPVYGGWESERTWADINCHGHTLGHYLSACAMAYRSTGNKAFKARIDYIASELSECQTAAESGLICAFPDGPALVLAHIRGDKITGVPWYTLHKIFAGLRDGAVLADSDASRAVLLRLADWTVTATAPLSDAQFETMLQTEHGGMSEVMADLYVMTGNTAYRDTGERFAHKAVLNPLSQGRDNLDGLHANTQIPKIVGFHRLWETTGKPEYRKASLFFWRTVALTRSYATGGHGDYEHFYPMADFADHVFSAKGSETCCIHNMLKLTRELFMHDPRGVYADFYERALYNGILASQDPDSGMATYFQGARPGYMKLYHTPEDSFWCCTGTGIENHVKYRDSIYFHDDNTLYVNLFIPSSVSWKDKGAVVTQETTFPETARTTLIWKSAKPVEATLKLRHPHWSRSAVVLVNGTPTGRSDTPGNYVAITRTWNSGDHVDLKLDMRVEAVRSPAAPDIVALTYGPLVLAGALGRDGLKPGDDIVINERKYGEYNNTPFTAPSLAGVADDLAARVRPVGAPLEFAIQSADHQPIRLVPYYQIAHERYATYWTLAKAVV